jgi:hypothetical protein
LDLRLFPLVIPDLFHPRQPAKAQAREKKNQAYQHFCRYTESTYRNRLIERCQFFPAAPASAGAAAAIKEQLFLAISTGNAHTRFCPG